MKAKELKELLKNIDDDAVVLLYDGIGESDVFCTLVTQVDAEHYVGDCEDGSCTDGDCDAEKFCVIAGFCTAYDTLDKCQGDQKLYMISDGPEAEPSRIAAEKARQEEYAKIAREHAERAAELKEARERRYCLNWGVPGIIYEENFNTMAEAEAYIKTIDAQIYDIAVFDRVEHKCVWSHEVKRG